jgi:polysaccharide export outer membrane protein
MLKKLVMILSLASLLGGCSATKLPPTKMHEANKQDVNKDYSYLIGPGDTLTIFVWMNPDLGGTFIVRPDGKITTSLVEDVKVSGKTTTQLARTIEEHLSTYVREPAVTVSADTFSGPVGQQVRVIGQASQPKSLNYTLNMTLLDVITLSGGLTDYADGNDAKLVRTENGLRVIYDLFIEDLMEDGNLDENIDVLPGDVIVIPEAWF